MRVSHYLPEFIRRRLKRTDTLPQFVTVGKHTYGVTRGMFLNPSATSPVNIGNFCSIAKNVRILCHANHPTDLPSQFPFRTLLTRRGVPPHNGGPNLDALTKGRIEIGHDVWIGEGVIILSGSTIGTGAVIGAGAVIAGEVPPYAVAIGNPKKILRIRFPEYVDRLLASKWWNLPDAEIARLDDAFYQKDINFFLEQVTEAWKRV